jgi:PilZ domain
MAQEVDEGVSYLKALKQSTAGCETMAATPPADNSTGKASPKGSPAIAAEQFRGPEKRRSTRYQCDGSAEIRAEGSDLQTWARFTDISLHGCYVEAQETHAVGTILHLKLEANGVRLENKGSVRVSYPHLGMGIAFLETSDETRGYLQQMLGSMARPTSIMGPGIASALPALDPIEPFPPITNPTAAMQALVEFFTNRQMLMREDFRRILRKSQGADTKP